MPDGTVPVLLSANTPALLRAEAAALLSYVCAHPSVPPHRVAGMLFRTRAARRHRALAMVRDHQGLADALRAVADGREHPAVVCSDGPATARRLAFVLPGQGAQRLGMGRLFYDAVPAYRAEADRCHRMFEEAFGESPLGYLLGDDDGGETTTVVQSALFIQMVSLGAAWRAGGVAPDAVIGHSQGEIAAAYLADKMTLEDAVMIIGTRSRAVEPLSSDRYAMAILAADRDECESVLARQPGWAQVSVVNSPGLVGISGDRDTVQAAVETLGADGRFTRVIPVRYPAHTSMVSRFRHALDEAVRGRVRHQSFLDSAIDCFGATLGEAVTPKLSLADYWFWNLRNTVRFDRAVAAAVASGVDLFVELAEHPNLQWAVQENLDALGARGAHVVGTSERQATDLTAFTRSLATVAVNDMDFRWAALNPETEGAVELPLLDFPNTQMNETTLWLPYHGTADTRDPEPPARAGQPQVLVEDWISLTRRAIVPPRRFGIVAADDAARESAAALAAHATTQGLTARVLSADDPCDDVGSVVVVLPALDRMTQVEAARHVIRFFTDRHWWRPGPTEYWLLTVGGESVLPDDPAPHPVPAAISAGFRCLGGEFPDIAIRHLDVSADDATEPIIAALHTADEPELALRGGALHAKRLVVDRTAPAALPLAGRHVLITGGTGAVGLEIAAHAATAGVRRVTLVSRSGETPAVTDRLRTLRGATEIRVIACDVADEDAVARLAAELADAPVDLVVHAVLDGADAADTDLAELTEARLVSALSGKAVGIAHVLDHVPLSDDCRIVLCSSIAAVLGGRGKIAYAAANRMLDAYARRLRAEGRDCVAVQWGQWAVYRGQHDAELANLAGVGFLPMRSADAIALGLGGLRRNAVVAAFDWDRAAAVLGALGYGPTLSCLTAAPVHNAPATDAAEKIPALLAELLGADDQDALDRTVPLVALGLDSLTALQLRRRVKADFDREIAVTDLLGGMSLDDVVTAVRGEAVAAAAGVPADRVEQVLLQLLADVIGADDPAALDGSAPLVALGLDSLSALQLRRRIHRELGGELAVTDLLGGMSLDDVAGRLSAAAPARR